MIRFHSFRSRLLALILALTGGVQLVTFAIMVPVHRTQARNEIAKQLENARRQFGRIVELTNESLARGAGALSSDTGLREALTSPTESGALRTATLRSNMESFLIRMRAPAAALIDLDGRTLAETRKGPGAGEVYRPLKEKAENAVDYRASGYAILDGELFSITVVPLLAPDPIAWIAIGFRLDEAFVADLVRTTDATITLRHESVVLVTTVGKQTDLITSRHPLPLVTGGEAEILLQYSQAERLGPARRLERLLATTGIVCLLLSALVSLASARKLSEPVQQLAAHTAVVASGDYTTRIVLERDDELGRLADAFNAMSEGLAERDRVRDLLDKNVSPEVAAQLMRDGAALGGEEREVTILFADLRGFTTLGEKLPPRELLTLLNRYLDRMSAEIEKHGGVIDKFVGDAIMALFGAPVSQGDAARRAVNAALAMREALAKFNVELAAEGRPALAIGIGINTARVVAGNIGSHRRLNYSVIGDGVNVSSRLQSLTRTAEYSTDIIVSAATVQAAGPGVQFRPLGDVEVKGRRKLVTIYSLDGSRGA